MEVVGWFHHWLQMADVSQQQWVHSTMYASGRGRLQPHKQEAAEALDVAPQADVNAFVNGCKP